MGAGGFVTLAGHFPDRTVVTYDPRGVERSTKADPASPSTPEQHADDLHRIIADARCGRRRPVREQRRRGERARARREAPGAGPDARRARAAARVDPARSRGRAGGSPGGPRHVPCAAGSAPAWRISSSPSAIGGSWTPRSPASPRPDPAMFGLPAEDDGNRNDALLGQNIISCTHYQPDFDALRAASTRIVVAAGDGVGRPDGVSRRRRRRRTPRHDAGVLPERPRRVPRRRVRPGRRPDAFAAKLREVLAGR